MASFLSFAVHTEPSLSTAGKPGVLVSSVICRQKREGVSSGQPELYSKSLSQKEKEENLPQDLGMTRPPVFMDQKITSTEVKCGLSPSHSLSRVVDTAVGRARQPIKGSEHITSSSSYSLRRVLLLRTGRGCLH